MLIIYCYYIVVCVIKLFSQTILRLTLCKIVKRKVVNYSIKRFLI